jgi:hypothetical protein
VNDDLVQPILLPPDARRYPLSVVLTAAGTASAAALAGADRSHSRWENWLAGRLTKSVRVAKSRSDIGVARACSDHHIEVDGFVAAAFAPITYQEMPHWMSRARVEGLRCEDDLPSHPGNGDWTIGLVAEMTAGKAAAQVSHMLCRLVLETGGLPTFSIYRAAETAAGDLDIVDAGLTEFDRPTRTVIANRMASA